MTTYDQAIGYDAAIPYDGGTLTAVDRTPAQNLRFEVAFATDPNAAAPAWIDVSDRVHLPSGITIRRGRSDEFDSVQTGTMTLTLENIDGALSPDNPSSPYYPNVLPQRRCRLTYRDPATLGLANMLSTEDASFEGGSTGAWVGQLGATVANSSTRAAHGTKSMLVTWPTAASGVGRVALAISGLTIGRRYTVALQAYVPTGVPNMRLAIDLGGGSDITVKNAWGTSTSTFTASAATTSLEFFALGATTAGQQTWVDAVVLDETPVGTTLGAFTTTSADSVILERFDGRVDRWPIEWPDGGQTYSRATITATDALASIGSRQQLRSVVVETFALDAPVVHFPLGESSDSTTVASIAGQAATLSMQQLGTGGTLELGAGTGVPTDGIGSPTWTSPSRTNGKYLTGKIPTVGQASRAVGTGCTLEAAIASTSTLGEASVTLSDRRGNKLFIGYTTTGNPYATFDPYSLITTAVCSYAVSYNDGQTHTLAATITGNGSTITLRLYVDGVLRDSSSTAALSGAFDTLTIGGMAGVEVMQAGTVSHVAAWGSPLTAAQLLEHRTAESTGFAGERSDQRLARVATWIGLPTERCAFDVGCSTSIGHIDTTGTDPLTYMRKIVDTEAGLLFAGTDGRLTFHNRARSYLPYTSIRTNGVANSSFEGDASSWAGVGGTTLTRTTAQAWTGSASLQMASTTVDSYARQEDVCPADPGETWTGSVYVKGSGTMQLQLVFRDAADVTTTSFLSTTITLSASWQRVTVTGLSGAGTVRARLYLFQRSAGVLTAYADGFLLEQAGSAGTYIDYVGGVDGPDLSLPVDMLDPSAGMAKDLQLVRNDVTGSRVNGATVRMTDTASIAAYGELTDSIDIVTTSDDDVAAAVAWRFNTSRVPLTRFTSMDLDALTDTTYAAQIRAAVDLGARIEITGMPSQAPTSTVRQTVQGYTENITDAAWALSINATPYAHLVALILDDPVYGALDSYPLAY